MPNALVAPANPVLAGLEGYAAIQDISGRSSRNALADQQVQKAQRQQNALDVYGKTGGNIDEVMKIDPETGIALQAKQAAAQHEQMKSQAEMIKSGMAIYDKAVITKPQDLDPLADSLESIGFPKGFVKRSKDFSSPQEFQSYLKTLNDQRTKGELTLREIQGQMALLRGQKYGENVDSQIGHRGVLEGQGQAHVDIARDRLDWDKTKPGKGGKDTTAKDEQALRKTAITQAKKDLQNMYILPNNPEYDTILQKQTDKNYKLLKGTGAGKGGGSEPKPTEQDVPINTRRRSADGTYWRNDNGVITKEQ